MSWVQNVMVSALQNDSENVAEFAEWLRTRPGEYRRRTDFRADAAGSMWNSEHLRGRFLVISQKVHHGCGLGLRLRSASCGWVC